MKNAHLLFIIVSCISTGQSQEVTRPNIILMMADDMGLGDTSAYQDFTGNHDTDQLHTPAMERLARMGVRFTDAHTPASRCSPTRYGLLTGRYPWRNRLKHWVLFGSQGDPMIERDRPTIASFLKEQGYHTGMVGKWHVGLRYQQSNGMPAAGFTDADLTRPLADSPLDHGFDFCRFTSRSHGTSGPEPGKKNNPNQNIGPGHIHGRKVIGATGQGRKIAGKGPTAYVLRELGGRHSDSAVEFLTTHVNNEKTKSQPFFLYYPSNSNHSPHTPDSHIAAQPVAGAATNVAGQPMDRRSDYIFENDVALQRLLHWIEETADPRNPGHAISDNTIVVFTSDNGAEKNSNIATGPFRSHKGSCYEGGHRVPFIISWPAGGIGDGNDQTPGRTSRQLLGLTDIYATVADILQVELPSSISGNKGAEDSLSMLPAMQGDVETDRPLMFNDHKQADDPAVVAIRVDNPVVHNVAYPGQWKLFLGAELLRAGIARPFELYDLATDSEEVTNCLNEPALKPVVDHLSSVALKHRTSGGHRLATHASENRVTFAWSSEASIGTGTSVVRVADKFRDQSAEPRIVAAENVVMTVEALTLTQPVNGGVYTVNKDGLGFSGGTALQFDSGEALQFSFDRDVIVESVTMIAGQESCGGYYQVGSGAPLAIYCVDADNDAKDQSGILSDIGVVPTGQSLTLQTAPHFGVESPGSWRVAALTLRLPQ